MKKFLLKSLVLSALLIPFSNGYALANTGGADETSSISLKDNSKIELDKKSSVALINNANIALNSSYIKGNNNSLEIGAYNKLITNYGTNFYLNAGQNNKVSGSSTTTLGIQNVNAGHSGVIAGYQNTVLGDRGIAIGTLASSMPLYMAQGTEIVFLQPSSWGVASDGVAIGSAAQSGGAAVSLGSYSWANGIGSIALGYKATTLSKDVNVNDYTNNTVTSVDNAAKLYKKKYNLNDNLNLNEVRKDVETRFASLLEKMHYRNIGNTPDDIEATKDLLTDQIILATTIGSKSPQIATAIGYLSKGQEYGSVALGALSIANRGVFDKPTKAPYSNFILNGNNTMGAVSVGNNVLLRQIINLADGTEDTDAVNLRQLKAAIENVSSNSNTTPTVDPGIANKVNNINNNLSNITKDINNINQNLSEVTNNIKNLNQDNRDIKEKISDLKSDSDEGDALGAALSALKPLDYNPEDKLQIMAGIGSYGSKKAVALGFAYYPSEAGLVHLGLATSFRNKLMWNAGASWRIGKNNNKHIYRPEKSDYNIYPGMIVAKTDENENKEKVARPVFSPVIDQILARLDKLEEQNKALKKENMELKMLIEKNK